MKDAQREVALSEIHFDKKQPRRSRDEEKLQELAESIASVGILQFPIVRPRKKGGGYDLVIGERRCRASRLAGLKKIPVIVREMSDEQVLEAQVIENDQREDVHPLEEADGYRRLMDDFGRSVDEIAAKLGRSKGYVYSRLKLCSLGMEGRKAYLDGKLTASTAVMVARIPDAKLQAEAVRALCPGWRDTKASPATAKEALRVIQNDFMHALKDASFDKADAELVPKAGPCTTCEHRTGNQPELFGDVSSKDVCTKPPCFKEKMEADWVRRSAKAEADGRKVLGAKESASLFNQWGGGDDLSYNSGFVKLTDRCLDDPKYRTYKTLLGKHAPPPVIARGPSGAAVEVLRKDDVRKALKAAGHKLGRAAVATSPGAAAEKRRRQDLKVKTKVARRALGLLVAEVERKDPDLAFWRELALAVAEQAWTDTVSNVCTRREIEGKHQHDRVHALKKAIEGMSIAQLRGLVFELCLRDAHPGAWRGYGDSFRRACKAYGVDLKAIERQERKALADGQKKKRAKKKTARKKAPAKKRGAAKASTKRRSSAQKGAAKKATKRTSTKRKGGRR